MRARRGLRARLTESHSDDEDLEKKNDNLTVITEQRIGLSGKPPPEGLATVAAQCPHIPFSDALQHVRQE
jgi:hypothetical protein